MNKKNKIRVCHITSAHGRYDGRIFQKECQSLLKKGYDVSLIVNDEFDDEVKKGVKIYSTKYKPQNRFQRMFISPKKIKKIATKLDADIYHLHDSELLSLVKFLKSKNKIVVFDSHEDYLHAIDDKNYIPKKLRLVVRVLYGAYEKYIIGKVDAAVVCYHWTEKRYNKYCEKVKMVFNFPIIKENSEQYNNDFSKRSISFAGSVTKFWCHKEIIEACSKIGNVQYELAGNLSGSYGEELKSMDSWRVVNHHGFLPFDEVYEKVYSNSSIGVALLDYISLCNGDVGNLSNTKIFEIMYSGLPLICTDFKLWREIIEDENCGIVVNPHKSEEIISAIESLLSNPEKAKRMGENGKKAVLEKYNWNECEKELFDVYDYLTRKEGIKI